MRNGCDLNLYYIKTLTWWAVISMSDRNRNIANREYNQKKHSRHYSHTDIAGVTHWQVIILSQCGQNITGTVTMCSTYSSISTHDCTQAIQWEFTLPIATCWMLLRKFHDSVILIWTQGICNVRLYGSIKHTYAVTVMGEIGFPTRGEMRSRGVFSHPRDTKCRGWYT